MDERAQPAALPAEERTTAVPKSSTQQAAAISPTLIDSTNTASVETAQNTYIEATNSSRRNHRSRSRSLYGQSKFH